MTLNDAEYFLNLLFYWKYKNINTEVKKQSFDEGKGIVHIFMYSISFQFISKFWIV